MDMYVGRFKMENTFDYYKQRCEILESQVAWYRRNVIECVVNGEVTREIIKSTHGEHALEHTKHANLKSLFDQIEKSNVITYEQHEDYTGIRFSHRISLFSGRI